MGREEKERRVGFEFGSPYAFFCEFFMVFLDSILIDRAVPLNRYKFDVVLQYFTENGSLVPNCSG
jgi:hypothetical protein